MKYKAASLSAIIILTIFILVSASGCFSFIDLDSRGIVPPGQDPTGGPNGGEQGDSDLKRIEPEDTAPKAVMEIYQNNSDGVHFRVGNPVYFSASSSYGTGRETLNFSWYIENEKKLSGEETSYIFSSPGDYKVTLSASNGIETDSVSRTIHLVEQNEFISVTEGYDMTVGIEYFFKNNGPGDILDFVALIDIPQTYRPFQIVKERKSNYKKRDEVFSDEHNLIASFNLGELLEGESVYAYVNSDVTLYEYNYGGSGNREGAYNIEEDFSRYTKGEYFINSDSQKVRSSVGSIIGSEKDPRVIAETLYDFVAGKLRYDEGKVIDEIFGYSYASDILDKEKGVCTDYSILYAALCRAAGIPAQFVQGIPVYSILAEADNKLEYAHAWVEIFLPGYGWIPVDITSEDGFMAYSYYLNLETYKGSGIFYKSLAIDGEKYYPTGYYYSWEGDTEPAISSEVTYSVSGLDSGDVSGIAGSRFLEEASQIISGYSSAVNHINLAHGEDWIFNDPQEIMIEETFLVKLKELTSRLANISFPQSLAAERNNLVAVSQKVSLYKDEQIKCMKSGDYDCSTSNYNDFTSSLGALFDEYNGMVTNFNEKY